jgi:enoyl-CoA hydratase/3-hydroxyacyl-CoA dehydrogenase
MYAYRLALPTLPLLRLNDLVGSDIGLHVGKNFVDSFPERVYISQIIPLLNQNKRLGEKTGSGFYKVCGGSCRSCNKHYVI